MYNCYAFTRTHGTVIIDLGLPLHEAIERCEAEAEFLRREFHLDIVRFGDDWYEQPGWLPRICMWEVEHDAFAVKNRRFAWLPQPE